MHYLCIFSDLGPKNSQNINFEKSKIFKLVILRSKKPAVKTADLVGIDQDGSKYIYDYINNHIPLKRT